MGKVTAKEAILNLLKDVDVKRSGDEKILKGLLDKLSQSTVAAANKNWTKADAKFLQDRITGKPVLEKFSGKELTEADPKFIVKETAQSTLVEGLLTPGGGGLQFNPTEKIGPIYKDDGSFGYFEFLKL